MSEPGFEEPPNIVFILTDDQGYWAMGCSGNREIRTPNLDRLADEGMRFENFFCSSPVCSPARASIMTGRIPSQHGVHDWIRKGNMREDDSPAIEYLKGMTGYTDILAANGYSCGMYGKWHLGDSLQPQKGFQNWFVHQTGGGDYNAAPMIKDGKPYTEDRYVTDAITDEALDFLSTNGNRKSPFYLSVHYTAPHSPWIDQHPQEIVNSYDGCSFDSCPEEPPHPWQINSAPRGKGEKRREILKGYFAAVTAMDSNVGRILDELERMGIREETMVVFMSDNGMNMGHHGFFGKGNGTFPLNMYDTSVKIPAIMSMPGTIQSGVGDEGLHNQYDFMPTLLDLLGFENPAGRSLPGTSFAGALLDQENQGRREVVVFDEYGPVRMIRNREWKYVHRYPYGPHELYDLSRDPDERDNLYGRSEYLEKVRELRSGLDEFFLRYVDSRYDGTQQGVYGKGQIAMAKRPGRGKKAFNGQFRYLDSEGNRRPSTYFPPEL